MRSNNIIGIVILAILASAVLSCEKNDTEEEVINNPCLDKQEPTADFRFIEVSTYYDDVYAETDKIAISNLGFQAVYQSDSVEHFWQIDHLERDRANFSMYFSNLNDLRPFTVQVTHKIKFKRDSLCFPYLESNEDSVTKTLQVVEFIDDLNMIGKFELTDTATNETYIAEIDVHAVESGTYDSISTDIPVHVDQGSRGYYFAFINLFNEGKILKPGPTNVGVNNNFMSIGLRKFQWQDLIAKYNPNDNSFRLYHYDTDKTIATGKKLNP